MILAGTVVWHLTSAGQSGDASSGDDSELHCRGGSTCVLKSHNTNNDQERAAAAAGDAFALDKSAWRQPSQAGGRASTRTGGDREAPWADTKT